MPGGTSAWEPEAPSIALAGRLATVAPRRVVASSPREPAEWIMTGETFTSQPRLLQAARADRHEGRAHVTVRADCGRAMRWPPPAR